MSGQSDEHTQLTNAVRVEPGGIPPFGSLFGLRTLVDAKLLEEPEINFNSVGSGRAALDRAFSNDWSCCREQRHAH